MKREKFPDFYWEHKRTRDEYVNVKTGRKNRELVRQFYIDNPKALQRECAKALGISQCTVGKHLKTINEN